MGSTRLPGKVMMKIGGKTILEHVVTRAVIPSEKKTDWMVITSTNAEDDQIAALCAEKGWPIYRGSDWDVLDRFYQAALTLPEKPDAVVRVNSDCPLHSYKVVDACLTEFENRGQDFFANSNHEPDVLEDGFDTEIFSWNVLEKSWKDASMLSEREHVCPYMKYSGNFDCGFQKMHPEFTYKLSVDSPADLEAVTAIYDALSDTPDFSIEEVVDLLKTRPDLVAINAESTINSGFKKSLENDRKA